jgi:hypothetical protein
MIACFTFFSLERSLICGLSYESSYERGTGRVSHKTVSPRMRNYLIFLNDHNKLQTIAKLGETAAVSLTPSFNN